MTKSTISFHICKIMIKEKRGGGDQDGKLAVLDLEEPGRQIGEKLFVLLSSTQKKELSQFIHDYEAGNLPPDVSYTSFFQENNNTPDQSLTEIREDDLYFCLEKR